MKTVSLSGQGRGLHAVLVLLDSLLPAQLWTGELMLAMPMELISVRGGGTHDTYSNCP